MSTLEIICIVCNDYLETHTEAHCSACGQPFHLNQRIDLAGKDCGQVWISDEHLALEFGCNSCLAGPPAEEVSLDDILDLGEAATAAGVSTEMLDAAAAAGQIRHRKTGGGVLLFERRDVLAWAQGPR